MIRGLCQLAVVAGVVIMLFVVYEVWITNIGSDRAQDRISHDLRHQWEGQPPASAEKPDFGSAFAFLHIPRLGSSYDKAVIEGTDPDELDDGPGHYKGTAMPGQQGNFALAGHRVGRGHPFLDLDEMQRGDAVVVETRDTWYVYRVTRVEIVDPSDTDVVAPTPDGPPGGSPTGAYLTLTTCNPKFSSRERLVVHGALAESESKAQAPQGPAVLEVS